VNTKKTEKNRALKAARKSTYDFCNDTATHAYRAASEAYAATNEAARAAYEAATDLYDSASAAYQTATALYSATLIWETTEGSKN